VALEPAAEEAADAAETGSNPDHTPSIGTQGAANVDCATE